MAGRGAAPRPREPMDVIARWAERYLHLSANDVGSVRPYLSPTKTAEGEILHREGEVCRDLLLLTSGLVRVYYVHEHREVNLRLMSAPAAVIALASFIDQVPARETIQALSDGAGIRFRLRDWADAHPGATAERLMRVLAERHYLSMERRLRTLQWKSARERYAYFVEHMEREIVEQVPGIHVASYLGVRPESLSRVRRQRAGKKRRRS